MSIIDPLGKRSIGRAIKPQTQFFEAHLRGPENYDTSRSRDIFNVARRLEAGRLPPTPKPPSLGQRLFRSFGLGKPPESPQAGRQSTGRRLSSNYDYQRMTKPVHRQLPEEHIQAYQKAAAEQRKFPSSPSSPSHRPLPGPIPRRPVQTPLEPTNHHLSHSLTTAFLTPLETEIYNIMRRVGRCATFTPITSPLFPTSITSTQDTHPRYLLPEHHQRKNQAQQIMLVHPTNVTPLRYIQRLACSSTGLSSQEKYAILRSLQGLLNPNLMGTLRTIFLREGVTITSSAAAAATMGQERGANSVRSKKVLLRRPESWEILSGRLSPSWEEAVGSHSHGYVAEERDVLYEERGYGCDRDLREKKKKAASDSLFKAFSQREYMPDRQASSSNSSTSSSSSPSTNNTNKRPTLHLHLRGGGDSVINTNPPLPFTRSLKTYLSPFSTTPLPDNARVPRTLYYLAGGRVSPSKKAPTAGELRKRKKAEVENRAEAGFVGTVFGVRRQRKREGKSGDGDDECVSAAADEEAGVEDAKGKGPVGETV